ncbi:hypothetical protein FRC12_001256 [Ceratobasidium sp. 428]|nr:hypothetical protein FRC12_001256 [Ceratobasidium sp. 428]
MILGPLQGHSGSVYSVAFSPRGRTIASGSHDKTVQVWDMTTGAAVIEPLRGHTESLRSVMFSSDGRLIMSGSDDKTVRLWDARTGRSAGAPIGVGAPVYSVAASPDDNKIVIGCSGGAMKTYDVAAGDMLFEHTGHTSDINSVAFSPDGRRIASASYDNTVRIWEASTGSSTGDPLKGHTRSVRSVAFSNDGGYIASGSYDKAIYIWDAATGVPIHSLQSHTDWVCAVAFTPDGSTLVSGSDDRTIKLWNMLGAGTPGAGSDRIILPSIRNQHLETYSMSPSTSVPDLDTIQPLFDEITSTTTPEQIVLHLGTRGCADLTEQLDLTSCSTYPISSGGFGDIYRCKLKDYKDVAIKTIRLHVDPGEQSQKHMKYAARELYTWSKCRHPNVQQLLGLVMFRDQIGMVAAWESNGDMPRYLQRYPSTNRCNISMQIVEGMSYLHESGVVHGDLKGVNILIAANGSPRLVDFGNAASQEFSLRFAQSSTRPGLSPRWAAPELFKGTKCNYPADIYALGMEAFTGDVPFPDKQDRQVMSGVMFKRLQPERPEAIIPTGSRDGDKMWSLLQWCWEYEPGKRPSTTKVKKTSPT